MLEQTIQRESRKISDSAKKLSGDLFDELIVAGRTKVEPVSYEQALAVLKYMRNEYVSAQNQGNNSFMLPEDFAKESDMGALFKKAFRVLKYSDRHMTDESELYQRCSAVYLRLRKVANEAACDVAEKIDAVDHLSGRLHCDCGSEGGFIGRIISREDRFLH